MAVVLRIPGQVHHVACPNPSVEQDHVAHRICRTPSAFDVCIGGVINQYLWGAYLGEGGHTRREIQAMGIQGSGVPRIFPGRS